MVFFNYFAEKGKKMIQNGKNPKSNVSSSIEFIATPPKKDPALSRFKQEFLVFFP
ncbi:hypothetical protein LEP1GSC058_3157 [Leptospira fainei serovar Hurstbridge str. BUT 6]|uniref:Uncharacterized protein n=1 Tax=Leptospira fainei serovar Hurstbridge str. BUT 6 TaxID=1193011 RepID=S3UZ43_9LEPT|nr:hypothetical protein LEP1GSC058_3157 [Leptospira fainei serovar Hurstbridge str. BUT 6]